MAKKVFEYQGKRRPKLHGFKKEFDIKVKDKDRVNDLLNKGWVEVKEKPKKTQKKSKKIEVEVE